MVNLIPLLGLAVSFLSMLGIFLAFYHFFKIESAFLPILTVSTVTLLTYLGGMVGGLKASAVFLHVLGIAALCYALILIAKRKLDILPILKSPAIWFFGIFCVYFVIQMRGMLVLHVDNFSHWATVIKEMCATDSFPTTGSAITFRNYTPGSAVFIYYICSAVGFSEGSALMAQGFMLSAALAVIFCKAKIQKPITLVSLIAVSVISVSIPELSAASLHYYNFLVDGLIAYITVAAGIIAYFYKNDLRRCLTVLIPVTSMLTVIKTSARLFAILITLFVLFLFAGRIFSRESFRNKTAHKTLGGIAALISFQLIMPSLWNVYVSNAFADSTLADNKFPSTLDGLISSLASKDGGYLKNIASMMYEKLTDLSDPVIVILLAAEIFALGVILITLFAKERPGMILPVFIFSNLTYGFYIIELFIMYGFIFPEAEAVILASFYRYLSTGAVITVTALLAGGVYRISQLSGKLPRITAGSAASVAVILFCVCIMGEQAVQIIDPAYRESTEKRMAEREKYSAVYGELEPLVPAGSSVIVYTGDVSFFAAVLPGYELTTASYSMMRPNDLADPEYARKRISGVEYVVVTDTVNGFFENAVGLMDIAVEGSAPSSVYKVEADSDTVTLVPVH